MPLPTPVAPSKIVTVLAASAVPVNVGVVILVLLSVLDDPVSLAAVKSGVEGAAGAVVSTSTAVVFGTVNVSVASLPAVSLMVPPFKAIGEADVMPSPSLLALCTV